MLAPPCSPFNSEESEATEGMSVSDRERPRLLEQNGICYWEISAHESSNLRNAEPSFFNSLEPRVILQSEI